MEKKKPQYQCAPLMQRSPNAPAPQCNLLKSRACRSLIDTSFVNIWFENLTSCMAKITFKTQKDDQNDLNAQEKNMKLNETHPLIQSNTTAVP